MQYAMLPSTEGAERRAGAAFLLSVAAAQVGGAAVWVVRAGDGRSGRLVYIAAFVRSMTCQLFAGVVVSASLVWAAWAALTRASPVESHLSVVFGTLWVGPKSVQAALRGVWWVVPRWRVLVAALGSYHRSAVHTDPDRRHVTAPPPVRRRLRAWPRWTPAQARCREWWHGRLVGGWVDDRGVTALPPAPVLVDAQLRLVARRGVALALGGDLDADSRRSWATALVADQARFPGSPLATVSPHTYPA